MLKAYFKYKKKKNYFFDSERSEFYRTVCDYFVRVRVCPYPFNKRFEYDRTTVFES